jgi:DNA-binding transcriptional MerR regulator
MEKVYSLGEVARIVGLPPHRITYLHSAGKAPEPERIFNTRAYRWSDIVALGKQLGVDVAGGKARGTGNATGK